MKILLIGHGRMGHLMERTALAQGDQLGGIVDVGNLGDLETIGRVADVAIDFSAPAARAPEVWWPGPLLLFLASRSDPP